MTELSGYSFAVLSLRNVGTGLFYSETSITFSRPHSRKQHSSRHYCEIPKSNLFILDLELLLLK
jgi:hypothetical protein